MSWAHSGLLIASTTTTLILALFMTQMCEISSHAVGSARDAKFSARSFFSRHRRLLRGLFLLAALEPLVMVFGAKGASGGGVSGSAYY